MVLTKITADVVEESIVDVEFLTQIEYANISTPDPSTIYIITK